MIVVLVQLRSRRHRRRFVLLLLVGSPHALSVVTTSAMAFACWEQAANLGL
jgi:hypothetical protein